MTLEEVIRVAESGDTNAMNSLGDYYFEESDFFNAQEWFSRAANAGSSYGIHQSMRCSMLLALACEDLEDWGEARSSWSAALDNAIILLEAPEVPEDIKLSAASQLDCINIGIGTAAFFLEDYDLAISAAKTCGDDARAQIILGLCHYRTGDGDPKYYALAQSLLSEIEQNPEIELPLKLRYFALMSLSFLYRIGDKVTCRELKTDLAASYHCVEIAANLPGLSAETSAYARSELRKFSKGLLGNYKYTG